MRKYSIAIPAFKEKFLHKCIRSILVQDYENFELIIVNDASPDNLDRIVNSFNDRRIRYYKNEKNFGAENVVDNWNRCLSYAKGDFFVLMGDDDEMRPDYLSVFDRLIDKFPDLDVYHCRSYIINDRSEILRLTPSWPEWESAYENIWHRMKGIRSQYISDFLYRTDTLRARGGFHKLPLAWSSDDITSFKAAFPKGIAHTQVPVFSYRESDVTISKSASAELKMKAISGEEQWYNDFLTNEVPENDIDNIFRKDIQKQKDRYFLRKRIETIAYEGIRKKYFLKDYIKHLKNRKSYNLSFYHMAYVLVLALKKIKAS